jgi:manganese/iron transport system permease protein
MDLLLPFQFPFMQKAFLVALLVAPPAALLSCFMVLKGWSLMGDAISHATLPGIVLAYMTGLPLTLGAFGAGMACALAVGFIHDNSRVKRDTVMGVVFAGMFGLGIVLYAASDSDVHLDHILFGNMLGVGREDLWTAGLAGLAVCLFILPRWRDLMLQAFDPVQAAAIGLPVRLLHYGLLAAISLMIVATLKAVGLILAIGLMILPGAIAFLLVRQFRHMLAVAVAVTVLATTGGVYLAFFLDSAPAPTVILVLSAMFVAAALRRRLWTTATGPALAGSAPRPVRVSESPATPE